MRPGPSSRMIRDFFGSDAGAGRARFAVVDMECFYRSTDAGPFWSSNVQGGPEFLRAREERALNACQLTR
jgi:hypothetical protein